jgi:hypothetical protein
MDALVEGLRAMMQLLTIDDEVWHKLGALSALGERAAAAPLSDAIDPVNLHISLNALNRARLQPSTPTPDWERQQRLAHAAELIEGRFLEEERRGVQHYVEAAPRSVPEFVRWFESLGEVGPGRLDPLFDFLATRATREQMTWFIEQEFNGEVGFEDLIALTQIRLPAAAKLDLARNFWDEMGNGQAGSMHGPMYVAMVRELGVGNTPDSEFVWETLALANLLTGLAVNRRYAWHSLGALTVTELTSPLRATRMVSGLCRLGLSELGASYFRLHSTADVAHWNSWRDDALIPLLTEYPELMQPLAEGALMRLCASARVLERYRTELGIKEMVAC